MFSSTTLNVNITQVFCGLHSMLLIYCCQSLPVETGLRAVLNVTQSSHLIQTNMTNLIQINLMPRGADLGQI